VWILLRKEFFYISDNIYIAIVYASPHNYTYTLKQDKTVFDYLEHDLSTYCNNGKMLLLGDFNARTQNANDYICDETTLIDMPADVVTENSQISHRCNMDTGKIQLHGKLLLDICKAANLKILNGRSLGDCDGKITCYKWNGCSTVDYGIAHANFLNDIRFFKVHNYLGALSDHCMISIGIHMPRKTYNIDNGNLKLHDMPTNFKWPTQTRVIFKTSIVIENVLQRLSNLSRDIITNNEILLESRVSELSTLLIETAESSLLKKTRRKSNKRIKHKRSYDKSCHTLNSEVKKWGKQLIKNPFNVRIRERYFHATKQYKTFIKNKQKQFKTDLMNKLEHMGNTSLSLQRTGNLMFDLFFGINVLLTSKVISQRTVVLAEETRVTGVKHHLKQLLTYYPTCTSFMLRLVLLA